MSATDVWAAANLGVFGLILPSKLTLATSGDDAAKAIKEILKKFSFPTLNITFSASVPLTQKKIGDDFKVHGYLKQIEARITIAATGGDCSLLGVYPDDTVTAKKDPPIQVTPDVGALASAVSPGLGGIVSALGITLPGLFKPSFPVINKAFIASPLCFGWYAKTLDQQSCEGVHYGVAILQVSRDVTALRVTIDLSSDWHDVDPDKKSISAEIRIVHPALPETPTLTDVTSEEALPLAIPKSDVRDLLGVTDQELDQLIIDGKLQAFGATRGRVSKGSLLTLLGLPTK